MDKPQDKRLEDREPAKGGTEPPKSKPYPSGDSPKPHGDPFKHSPADKGSQRSFLSSR